MGQGEILNPTVPLELFNFVAKLSCYSRHELSTALGPIVQFLEVNVPLGDGGATIRDQLDAVLDCNKVNVKLCVTALPMTV